MSEVPAVARTGDRLTSLIGRLSPVPFFLVLGAFALPFLSITATQCSTPRIDREATYSGFELVSGRGLVGLDAELLDLQGPAVREWAMFVAACAIAGAGMFLVQGIARYLSVPVLGLLGMVGVMGVLSSVGHGYTATGPDHGSSVAYYGFSMAAWLGTLALYRPFDLSARPQPTRRPIIGRLIGALLMGALLLLPLVGMFFTLIIFLNAANRAASRLPTGRLQRSHLLATFVGLGVVAFLTAVMVWRATTL